MLNMPILKFEKSINYLKSQLQIQNNNKQLILDIITNIGLLINNSSNDELLKYESILEAANNYLQIISTNITTIKQLDLEISNITNELNDLLEEQNKTTKTKEFYIAAFSNIKHNIILYSKKFQNIENKLETDNLSFNNFINVNNFKYTFNSVNDSENDSTNNYEFTGFSIDENESSNDETITSADEIINTVNEEPDSTNELSNNEIINTVDEEPNSTNELSNNEIVNTVDEESDSTNELSNNEIVNTADNTTDILIDENRNEINNLTNQFKELLTSISEGKITENTSSILDDYINSVKSNFNINNNDTKQTISETFTQEINDEGTINIEIPTAAPVFFDFSEKDLELLQNEENTIYENSNSINEPILIEQNFINPFIENNLFEETIKTPTTKQEDFKTVINEDINNNNQNIETIVNEDINNNNQNIETIVNEDVDNNNLNIENIVNEDVDNNNLNIENIVNEDVNNNNLNIENIVNEDVNNNNLNIENIVNEDVNNNNQNIENIVNEDVNNNNLNIENIVNENINTNNQNTEAVNNENTNNSLTFSDIELLISNVKTSNSTVENNFQDVESTLNEINDLINPNEIDNTLENSIDENIIEEIDDTDFLLDILSEEENLISDSIVDEDTSNNILEENSSKEKENTIFNNEKSKQLAFDNLNLSDEDIDEKISNIIEAKSDNEDLIISEKNQQIYLPYKISELVNYINSYPNVYSSLQDVVKQEFILPFDYFQKHPYKSRFSETYNILKNREGKGFFKSISYSLNLAKNSNLNPAVIAACKTLNELESYLYYTEANNLKRFKFFNIIYQVNLL